MKAIINVWIHLPVSMMMQVLLCESYAEAVLTERSTGCVGKSLVCAPTTCATFWQSISIVQYPIMP